MKKRKIIMCEKCLELYTYNGTDRMGGGICEKCKNR